MKKLSRQVLAWDDCCSQRSSGRHASVIIVGRNARTMITRAMEAAATTRAVAVAEWTRMTMMGGAASVQVQAGTDSGKGRCFNCGVRDHFSTECTKPRKEVLLTR
jgi:hypothetical protein